MFSSRHSLISIRIPPTPYLTRSITTTPPFCFSHHNALHSSNAFHTSRLTFRPKSTSAPISKDEIKGAQHTKHEIQGIHQIKDEAPHELSPEQQSVLNKVTTSRDNVFLTGSAGTGKSYLLTRIIDRLREQGKAVHVTSSTGISALNIDGTTIHSYAGIGLGTESAPALIDRIRRKGFSYKRILRTQVLVLDEVSMISATLFDKLNEVFKVIRKNSKPFGGIQVIIMGDFHQLPPLPGPYAFESKSWGEVVQVSAQLTEVFRQTDSKLIHHLNNIRMGVHDKETVKFFQSLEKPEWDDQKDEKFIKLGATRREVEWENLNRLAILPGKTHRYRGIDLAATPYHPATGFTPNDIEEALKRFDPKVPLNTDLRVGAQVMIVKNLVRSEIVNGSLGTVVSFLTIREIHARLFAGVEEPISHLPGVDNSELWASMNKFVPTDQIADRFGDLPRGRADVLEQIEALQHQRPDMKFPVVQIGDQLYVCNPNSFPYSWPTNRSDELGEKKKEVHKAIVARLQIPLILGWALTIHKSQGQTIDRVHVDCANIFAEGQLYTALSRAKSLDGLRVTNFRPDHVMANRRVKSFMKTVKGVPTSEWLAARRK